MTLTIVSCTSIPVTSLYKLSKIDIRTLNPRETGVALKFPSDYEIGQVKLKFSYTLPNQKENPLEFILVKKTGQKGYQKYKQQGYSIISYSLSEKDAERLIEKRRNILVKKKPNRNKGETKISISYKGLCKKIPNDKSFLLSIYLKTSQSSGYFPFIQNMDMFAKAKEKGYRFDTKYIKLCSSSNK